MKQNCYNVSRTSNVDPSKRKWIDDERAPQYRVAAAVSIGALSMGCCLGYSSPALPSIKSCSDFPCIENSHLSWIGSLLTIGALCGSALGGLSIEKLGRKNTLIVIGVPFTIGWFIMAFANHISMLYIGRLLTGFGVGGMSVAGPVYLSEISQPAIRGFLGAMFQVVVVVGILFSFVVGSFARWNVLAAICGSFPIIFTACVTFLPESPRYLLSSGKTKDAIISLAQLRAGNVNDPSKSELAELDELQESIQRTAEARRTNKTGLWSLPVLKPLMITLALMIFNQFCGFQAVSFYTVSIFEEVGFGLDAHLSSIIVAVVQVIAIAVASQFVEKVGRRPFLIFSFGIMCISLLTLGIFFRVKDEELSNMFSWVPLASVIVFNAAYSGGTGCLVWTVMSEILPTHIIGFGSGLATTLNWSLAFVTTKFFHDMNSSLGIYCTFWLFASSCALGCLFVFVFVPETKGKSLDQIHKENFRKSCQGGGLHMKNINPV